MSVRQIVFTDYLEPEYKPKFSIQSQESEGDIYFGQFTNSAPYVFELKNGSGNECFISTVNNHDEVETLYGNKIPTLCSISKVKCQVILPPKKKEFSFNKQLFGYFKKNPDFIMVFEVNEEEIQAIIPIMRSRSAVLDAMFNSECTEAKTKRIKIVDFSSDVVKVMIKFCETDELACDESLYRDLAFIAEKYDIEALRIAISAKMMSKITTENFYEWFSLTVKFKLKDLQNFCGLFAHHHSSNLLSNENITTLTSDELKSLTQSMKSVTIE